MLAIEDGIIEETESQRLRRIEDEEDVYHLKHDGEPVDPVQLTPKNFIDIARVVAGGSIGELALIDGKQRFSTIKCL